MPRNVVFSAKSFIFEEEGCLTPRRLRRFDVLA